MFRHITGIHSYNTILTEEWFLNWNSDKTTMQQIGHIKGLQPETEIIQYDQRINLILYNLMFVSIHIFHSILYKFPMVKTRRICLTLSLLSDHFLILMTLMLDSELMM